MSDRRPHFSERNLAEAAVAGPWDAAAVARRLRRAVGRKRGFIGVARRLLAAFPTPPTAEAVLPAILADPQFQDLSGKVCQIFWSTPTMTPGHGWAVPVVRTTAELAGRLGLTIGELDWFADVQGRNPRQARTRLQHCSHCWVPKRGGRFRLLEVPKPRLKVILREILAHIPPHDAAHGFRPGRSIRTFAEPHANRTAVWRIDLKDFFPSIRASRVHAIFRAAGYPIAVARALTGLCTTALPASVKPPDSEVPLADLRERHLPQGAPTSPALANLAAYWLDVRLAAWAGECGITYTRYADDLAFSGDESFARSGMRFRRMVWQIITEEGFRANAAKSRWMTAGHRQHLAGVIVNRRPNVRRGDFDRLKAILTNCVRHGPAGQNRDGHPDFRAHLLGRVAHVAALHPERGKKLRGLADRIDWSR
jgi:RNA-directed DNA polymerase